MKTLTRRSIPETIDHATSYSDDPALADPRTLISMLRGMPQLLNTLIEPTVRSYEWGPARMSGDWPLIYLVFVISRIPDIEPWYQRVATDRVLWRACGFEQIPSYHTVYLRFRELEAHASAFESCAAQLMQKAKTRDPRVGAWLHIDASEAETHASPQHDCEPGEGCPTDLRAARLHKASVKTAAETRREIAKRPTDEEQEPIAVDGLQTTEVSATEFDHRRNVFRFRSGGHWWSSRDPEAGTRAYTRKSVLVKAWHGYLHIEIIDHLTHAPIVSWLIPANQQEHSAYQDVFQRAVRNLGNSLPLAVAADKGYSFEDVFRFNTDLGVSSVIPYRRRNGAESEHRRPTATHDEYGIPVCSACGGDTTFVRFAVLKGKGRIWFKCALTTLAACQRVQSIQCSRDYRALLPLWRTEPAYAALRESHSSYEHKHRDLRIQYLVAPDCLALRPKRPGRACQQLRASAALLIEWLRVTLRAGLLGGPTRVGPSRPNSGNGMVERLRELRVAKAALRSPDPP